MGRINNMNFEAVIGLETHIETNTKSKMFSSAPNLAEQEPNTEVALLDMAFPGTMPRVNKEAVRKALRIAHALHMTIDDTLYFERKNYFYSDLPKGYQITQQFRPIGRNGYVEIEVGGKIKKIRIERIHMEEDTCKQLHFSSYSLLDYNRAGVPLIEIVTMPDIRTGEEARKYVEKLREIVTFADVSDGKMENGSMRCDTNISIRPYGVDKLGTKVEVKNLNSIVDIEKALDYEIKRQSESLLMGIPVIQETRRFDEGKKETVTMRIKTDAVDYKYFTEPNIAPIKLSKEFIEDAINTCPELYDQKLARFTKNYGIELTDIKILLSDKNLADYFDECAKFSKHYQSIANFMISNVLSILNKENKNITEFKVEPKYISELVELLENKEINSSQGKKIFESVVKENKSPLIFKKELGATLINDESTILDIIKEVIKENPSLPADFKAGKTRAQGFVMGQVMKKTQGKANPGVANKLIVEELKK
jgi:aspartyl-tRNA(Asn)/glutamyl-tRNA(Gln) amidotransferase subunit B